MDYWVTTMVNKSYSRNEVGDMSYIIAYLIIGLFVFIYNEKHIDNYTQFGVVDLKLLLIVIISLPWVILTIILRYAIKLFLTIQSRREQ